MSRFVQVSNRDRVTLLPECLDDYIADDNPVRAVDAFVEELDFGALGFSNATPAIIGRPGTHPRVLLKIYIYGYLNRAASSHRLCRDLKLFTQAVAAIDGSKFKTVNSRGRNFTPTKIDPRIEQIEESVQRYLEALETADRTQSIEAEAKAKRLTQKIAGFGSGCESSVS